MQTIVAEQVNTHQLRSFSGMQNSKRGFSINQHDNCRGCEHVSLPFYPRNGKVADRGQAGKYRLCRKSQ